MSTKYKLGAEHHAHFVTFTVVKWIDFFVRNEYREVFMKSVNYCQENKSLEVYAYCIMPSHVHMILRSAGDKKLEDVIRDLKSFTSRSFHDLLMNSSTTYESRKKWLLLHLKDESTNKYQFWQVGNHPIELYTDEVFYQKMDYIHMNPVVSGFVSEAEHWLYSSASIRKLLKCNIELAVL